MAKKTTNIEEQRASLFNDLRTNQHKTTLNKIYNSVVGSQKTIEQVINDDALFAGAMGNKRSQTTFSNNVTTNDCIAAANEPEIADILDKLVDELIVFNDSTNKFCEPNYLAIENIAGLEDKEKEELKEALEKSFNKVYRLLKFSKHNIRADKDITAKMKEWLVTGKLAYFIVYDNVEKPTTIKDIIPINLSKYSLVRHDEYVRQKDKPAEQAKLVTYWSIHENAGYDRSGQISYRTETTSFQYSIDNISYQKNIFTDAEIVMADWSSVEYELSRFKSYTATLLRSFNILRIMERTRIIWAVMNSRFRTMFVIPVKGQGRIRGKQTIQEIMAEYKDHVQFNDSTGQIAINGSPDLPFNKEIWVGEGSSGRPEIENLGNDTGPDLSNVDELLPWYQKLQKASRLPMSRFEDNNSIYWDNNPMQISLEERRFAKMIDKFQQTFVEVIRKPMYNLLLITNSKYIGDLNIYDAIGIKCNKYDTFTTMMELEMLSKVTEMIKDMKENLTTLDKDGREVPVLSTRYLINKYLPMTKADKDRNAKFIEEEIEAIKKAELNGSLDDM